MIGMLIDDLIEKSGSMDWRACSMEASTKSLSVDMLA